MKNDNLPLLGGQLVTSMPEWLGHTPRAWQATALEKAEAALRAGKRGVVRACTGSGKSLLQAELVARAIEHLGDGERIVVSAPTQKLVAQLGDTIAARIGEDLVGRYFQYDKETHAPVIVTCHASMFESEVLCPQCHPMRMIAPIKVELFEDALARARMAFEEAAIGGDFRYCRNAFTHTRAVAFASRLTSALLEQDLEVSLWLADECHKTECDQVLGFAEWVRPARTIGFTATPWRSSENESLTLFDDLIFDYGPTSAIKDGVVIQPTIRPYSGNLEEVDEVCLEMIQNHLEVNPGPGVVSADSIDDADLFATYLEASGVRARSIHSRLSGDQQANRLEMLERGELDCLVHVCLLAEGVDLPWLEWLCLRRMNSSRVRFVQEVGRVIRTYPGKSRAWVMDPHDLFGRLSLDYSAVLGGESDIEAGPQAALDKLADEVAALFADPEERLDCSPKARYIRRAKGLDALRAWLRQQAVGLRLAGYEELKVNSTSWRTMDATEKQVGLVEYLIKYRSMTQAAAKMSESERVVMRELVLAAGSGQLNRGDVSDLITILSILRRESELPRLEEIEEVAA